jgi:hypothetical protein
MSVGWNDPEQKREKVEGLIQRYRLGEISEAVFTASLKATGMRETGIKALVIRNRSAFQNSRPYKRGDVR